MTVLKQQLPITKHHLCGLDASRLWLGIKGSKGQSLLPKDQIYRALTQSHGLMYMVWIPLLQGKIMD